GSIFRWRCSTGGSKSERRRWSGPARSTKRAGRGRNRFPTRPARCWASSSSRRFPKRKPSQRCRRRRDGSRATSGSGCGGCRLSLRSTPLGLRRRLPMRSSRWDAHGNVYLVTEESLTPDRVRAEVDDTDGILEVFRSGEDWVEIAIWNPDGSRAEMSGNGTRIAARWLAERTGAESVVVRVGPREVRAVMLDGPLVEQDMGEP